MTGNLQIDHRKNLKKITLTTADGQFEGLQGVLIEPSICCQMQLDLICNEEYGEENGVSTFSRLFLLAGSQVSDRRPLSYIYLLMYLANY